MLFGEVPSGEFVPLEDCPRSLTEDAKKKIAAGATLYGWPAFEEHFQSIAYIKKEPESEKSGADSGKYDL